MGDEGTEQPEQIPRSPETYFGPPGFTDVPEVRELLAPYEQPSRTGRPTETIYFEGLPLDKAKRLAQLLPRKNNRYRPANGPRFTQLLHLGRDYPELRFYGYRCPSGRPDEGVFIRGYYYPPGEEAEQLYQHLKAMRREPDEYYPEEINGESLMFGWWD